MSNIIDSIQLSGVTYTLSAQTGGGGVPESTFTAYTATTDERISQDEEVTAAGLNALNEKITPTVELTQAEYDALVTAGTVSADTYYIITDAQAVDLTQYWTSAQTQSAINQATSGKVNTSAVVSSVTSASTDSEIPTAKAVWEAASGGGTTYTAGRGIDITNDTISFSLPISAGTGTNSVKENTASNIASGHSSHAEGINTNASSTASHAEGNSTTANGISSHAEGQETIAYGYYSHTEGQQTSASSFAAHAEGIKTTASGSRSHAEGGYTTASGAYSHAEGTTTTASGDYSHAEGRYTIAQNEAEHASGKYNVSSKANTTFGDSGNTLFSIGNGYDSEYRHNVLDIRQNGDIYIADTSASGDYSDKPMIKLQESLGCTVSSAITSGDTNPVQGGVLYNKFDEIEQVTARALNQLSEGQEVTARALVDLHDSLSGKADTSAVTAVQDSLSGYVATSAVTTTVTSGSTSVITSGGVYQQMGGLKMVKLTQSAYDNLQNKDSSTLYVIVN